MTLRESHSHPRIFDAIALFCAIVSVFVAWLSFSHGGNWSALGWVSLVCLSLLLWGTFVEPSRLRVIRRRESLVLSPTIWIRIVFLSDLHAGGPRPASWYERLARETSALNPDVLFLGGDHVVDRVEPVAMLAPFSRVSARFGKYFVLGNHDFLDRPQEIRAQLQSFGLEDLTNRSVVHSRDGKKIELSGVDDHWHGNPKLQTRTSSEIPHVLLAHEPDVLMDLQKGDVDLVFAGHTHGGQVALPLIGSLWPIPTKLGRRVSSGRCVMNGVPCLVSEGAGEADARYRLFTNPEILVVEVGI
jgi:predicted MPP superfamily phosphohydrolase